ncbi:MAG: glycerol-3-phosphate 1-O-acyltransferase PlsY [Bacteroidetes bacterium]|nr:glycerol-3-phosphate 1-O-acyltransferase PlsY [Bacteroidota bacterium]
MTQTLQIISLIIAYLIGSIPSAVWIGKIFYGIDVREYGSGNAGATNTFRVLGKKAGMPVLLIDILKGFAAVQLPYLTELVPGSVQFVNLQLVLGVAALFGHIFPLFAAFKGGKGIATLLGIILAVHPYAALMSIAVFLVVFLVSKYVSLGSITAALTFPIIVIVVFKTRIPSLVIFSMVIAVLVLITHQKNIERLIKREESKSPLIKRKTS